MPPHYAIDEQLPTRAAKGLQTLGFDAVHVKAWLGEETPDREVVASCRHEGRVLGTRDRGSKDDAIIAALAEFRDVAVILVPDGVLIHELAEIMCGRWRKIARACERSKHTGQSAPYFAAMHPSGRISGDLKERNRPTAADLARSRRRRAGGAARGKP
jgi:hypothetical protein